MEEVVIVNGTDNAFDDGAWKEQPIEQVALNAPVQDQSAPVVEAPIIVEEIKKEEHVIEQQPVVIEEPVKKIEFEPIKFANEESERLFNAIKEGRKDEAYSILNEQKRFEKLSNIDVSNVHNAAEVLKAKLEIEYKGTGLESDDIDFFFNEKYAIPEKPNQTLDQTDDEYELSVKSWENKVKAIEKRMIIDAKIAKPELAKLHKEIVLPDIPRQEIKPEVDQKVLEQAKADRLVFEQSLENDYKNFNGFNVVVKDKEVEIPISYSLSDEEKVAVKQKLQDFNVNEYFGNRWFNKEGKPNVNQMQTK